MRHHHPASLNFLDILLTIVIFVDVLPTYMSVHHDFQATQKRALEVLGPELQMVVRHHIGAYH